MLLLRQLPRDRDESNRSADGEGDLVVEVERFEGDDRGEVVLAVRWQLYRPGSGTPIRSRQSRLRQPGWTYGDDATQARMLGANVQELARQIAENTGR